MFQIPDLPCYSGEGMCDRFHEDEKASKACMELSGQGCEVCTSTEYGCAFWPDNDGMCSFTKGYYVPADLIYHADMCKGNCSYKLF